VARACELLEFLSVIPLCTQMPESAVLHPPISPEGDLKPPSGLLSYLMSSHQHFECAEAPTIDMAAQGWYGSHSDLLGGAEVRLFYVDLYPLASLFVFHINDLPLGPFPDGLHDPFDVDVFGCTELGSYLGPDIHQL
jgi:hypothetical protein